MFSKTMTKKSTEDYLDKIVQLKNEIEAPNPVYVCLNLGEAFAPREIGEQSICIDGDIGEILKAVSSSREERDCL